MNAFVSGALSALGSAIKLIDQLDPEGKNELLQGLKQAYLVYSQMYMSMDGNDVNIPKTGLTEALKEFDERSKKLEEAKSSAKVNIDELNISDDEVIYKA